MTCCSRPLLVITDDGVTCRNCTDSHPRFSQRSPRDLTDEALTSALELAKVRRELSGALGPRTALAELEDEAERRLFDALEKAWTA